MSEDNDTSEAVERALKSVEQLESEAGDDLDPDAVEVLPAAEIPPSGDPSGEGHAPDPELEQEFADADEDELEAEATGDAVDVDDDDDGEPAPKKKDPKDAMLEAMIQAKHELNQVLEQTQKEAKSLHDRLVRVTADYDNFRKRQTREREEALKFANERLLKDLLPVIDNMERAAEVGRKAMVEAESELMKSVVEGVEMVHKSFMDTFTKFGIEGFTSVGEIFDPARHEAVAQREDASVPNSTVLEEYQRGYLLNGRLVRPSMVIVSSGGPPAGAAKTSQDEEAADGDGGEAQASSASAGEDESEGGN